ncbi:MAG: nucleoside/nucleotide kinase family protein [Propionibacteriaceae bacterium]
MTVDVGALSAELSTLAASRPRTIIGICGAPGAGKSTLAELVVKAVNAAAAGAAVAVGMDGFHLAKSVIVDDDRGSRRGAPDTFDAAGYAALLARLRTLEDDIVYAPEYRREIEDPVNAAIPVPRSVRLVVTEGNYLLHPDWAAARAQVDEVWYLEAPDESVRVEHLIARHVRFGKSPDRARTHVLASDESNAALVASHREKADRVLRWQHW